ncbi:hypothetical protein ACFV9C_44650 [Kribbella sp. NPDC059898]|uniref:hypothetical protein n=1 Tax=Kribbella sp. NPDC059898 TaxID=3346995 RepID=UPI00365C5065
MGYTDAHGRAELIAGDFIKKSTGSATIHSSSGDAGNDGKAGGGNMRGKESRKSERKRVADR